RFSSRDGRVSTSVGCLHLHGFSNPELRWSAFRGTSGCRPKAAGRDFNIVNVWWALILNSEVVARSQLIERCVFPLRRQVSALGVSDTDQIILHARDGSHFRRIAAPSAGSDGFDLQ